MGLLKDSDSRFCNRFEYYCLVQNHFVNLTLNLEFIMTRVNTGVKQSHQRKQDNLLRLYIYGLQIGNGNILKQALIKVAANLALVCVSHIHVLAAHGCSWE